MQTSRVCNNLDIHTRVEVPRQHWDSDAWMLDGDFWVDLYEQKLTYKLQVSAFVATYANTQTSAPIYICAVLYIAMVSRIFYTSAYSELTIQQAVVAALMPFEPYGKRSM